MDEEELDLRGLKCPLPALLARRALARARPGTTIMVLVDDPMAPIDVPLPEPPAPVTHEDLAPAETAPAKEPAKQGGSSA